MRNPDAANPLIPATPSDEAYGAEDDQGQVFTNDDPAALFADWLALAGPREMNDPNAMALATVDGDGLPDVRIVLLKAFDAQGLSFFTNTKSAKGSALAEHPKAALCFHWKSIRRQVRFRGTVKPVSEPEADAYFASRARGSQIGAWASDQSRPLSGRETLQKRVDELTATYEGKPVPRPPHWSGFRVEPIQAEFWVNRPYRLHERMVFQRETPLTPWQSHFVYP
ncbi:MAG: pyridoxamine 5'-phosphate oxidase [Pseudomonadota bacterium]